LQYDQYSDAVDQKRLTLTELDEASTHKSAKTHVCTVYYVPHDI